MKTKSAKHRTIWRMNLMLLAVFAMCATGIPVAYGNSGALATITGSVKDNNGNPLAGAIIALLREGADEVVKQTRTAADGSFVARIAPGRYSLRAEADGFNVAAFPAVQVRRADELIYRFNLQPVGSGRTAPERRRDRDSAKWRLRSSQGRRSIFQAQEGEDQTIRVAMNEDEAVNQDEATEDPSDAPVDAARSKWGRKPRTQGVVEAYAVTSSNALAPGYAGLNFAIDQPVNESIELIFAGQFGAGENAPQRFEATARVRAGDRHRIGIGVGGIRRGALVPQKGDARAVLGQFSMRAVDEWVVRDGIVVVLGLDYARLLGASKNASVSPRLGFQFDANARTRVRAAYAPGGEAETAQSVVAFEDNQIVFKQPVTEPVALVDGRAVIEKSRRFEFGVERVIDNDSSIEATAFFDTVSGRGIGLMSMPIAAFNGEGGDALLNIANQEGAARGVRIVYSRRISRFLSASAGYSFGRGQKLASTFAPSNAPSNPADFFENGFFQTVAAQLDADIGPSTRVHTIFRFSPRATVFAIDPFAGRLAVFDPSLSILVTQELPTFGLPVRAEAVIDARNLFDTQVSAEDGETLMTVNQMRRSLRGGISVRF